METTYMPIKTGFRNKTLNIPMESLIPDPSKVKNKRCCIGGRGREWGPECFRILELMVKREDTEVLMQPVDAVQNPDYYSVVKEPIDLSKIQLRFHSGYYQSMFTFVDDVHLMFNNYSNLYDEPFDPVLESLKKLKDWFDEEMEKIRQKWFFGGYESAPRQVATKSTSLPKEIGERIDAIEAENRSVIGPQFLMSKPDSGAATTKNNLKIRPRMIIKDAPLDLQPITSQGVKNSPLVLKKLPMTKAVDGKDGKPLYTFQISKAPPTQKIIISQQPGTSTPNPNPLLRPKSIIVIPAVSTAANKTVLVSSNKMASTPKDPFTVISRRSETVVLNGESHDSLRIIEDNILIDKDSLVINNSNLWLGVTQVTSTSPILVNDDGVLINFKMTLATLKKSRGGPPKSRAEQPLTFLIRPDDLVKCYAHITNAQKHTIFLMVLPNCIRRLNLLLQEKLRKMEGVAGLLDSFVDSCLITIFTPALSKVEISQLMYFMWTIGKNSMFGSNLYTEINQRASLKLLGNVKPTLFNNPNVASAPKSSSDPSKSQSGSNDGRSSANSTMDSVNSNMDLGNPTMDLVIPNMDLVIPTMDLAIPNMDLVNPSTNSVNSTINLVNSTTNLLNTSVDLVSNDDPQEGNKTDDQSDGALSLITEVISSENIELEEIPLDDIQLKADQSYDGPEIINLDESKEQITILDNDDDESDNQSTASKPRHKPGILSRRKASKRSALTIETILPPKKGKIEEEEEEDRKSSASFGECHFTADGVLVQGLEGPEIIDMDEIYKEGFNKDYEIVHPEDSDSDGSELEIKYLDQTEEGELMWTGRKISIRCPITQKIMKEPVRNEICGHTYDKIGVEELVKNRGTRAKCPVPGCRNAKPLELSHLEPDETVKQILQNK